MTCPNAPACCGRPWRARSTDPRDVEAFKADVVAYLRRTGRRDVGKACAAVYAAAMAEAQQNCVLS